jgi:hypothetical protein
VHVLVHVEYVFDPTCEKGRLSGENGVSAWGFNFRLKTKGVKGCINHSQARWRHTHEHDGGIRVS